MNSLAIAVTRKDNRKDVLHCYSFFSVRTSSTRKIAGLVDFYKYTHFTVENGVKLVGSMGIKN